MRAGPARAQAEGAHLRLLYPDGGSEDGTAEEHLRMAAETGEYNGEGHRIRSDGSTFWAYVTLTALRNQEGELVGYTKVTRDFSARRAVEAAHQQERHLPPDAHRQEEEANRLRRVVTNISHELRTPLNAILGRQAVYGQVLPGLRQAALTSGNTGGCHCARAAPFPAPGDRPEHPAEDHCMEGQQRQPVSTTE